MKSVLIFLLLAPTFIFAQEAAKPATEEPLVYRPRPKGEVVTEAVAQAGQHVVTSREVLISHILDEAMNTPIKKTPPDRKTWLLAGKSELQSAHLAQVLLEIVVQLEAENFSIGQVSQEDLQTHKKHIFEQVKGWEPWKNLQVSEREIDQLVQRKLRAKNFLKFKLESSGVQISDEEAKAFYEKNRVKFGNLPFAQFKESIKEVLARNQLQEKLKDWFEILKRKYRVRYLGQSG